MNDLLAVASFGLDRSDAPAAVVVEGVESLVRDAEQHRLTGLLAAAVRAGALETSEEGRRAVEAVDERWQAHGLLMARLLIDVVETFTAASIPHRVIKGPALAQLAFAEPAHRVFGDIDIVVPGPDLARARRLLVAEFGADDPFPELRAGFDAAYAKDVLLRVDAAEIDLHRTLAAGPFGHRIRADDLFERSSSFELGGTVIATLGAEMTFVQVCYNAALGDIPPRLMSLRDVAQVHKTLSPDPAGVWEIAQRWGGQTVVATAITLAWDALGLAEDEMSSRARAHRPGIIDRRYLDASRSVARSYTRHIATLASIRGVRAKVGYARAIGRPDDEYLEARGWTATSHLKRAVRRLSGR